MATKQPTPNHTSSSLSSLPPAALQSLRQAFTLLDADSDGQISASDLTSMLGQLGEALAPSTLQNTYFPSTLPKPFTLPAFITLLSQAMNGLSEKEDLMQAFEAFDEHDDGVADMGELMEALTTEGERMTREEVERAVSGGFVKRRGLKQLGRGGGEGEVFEYGRWVGMVAGEGEEKK
ncbi:EF-hand [Ascobolus immersus RN42]|uniref:EF-hand n=1 Tax=Ascobolus immersus RN42 TaxID=1160509 RepID=A0A3N4HLZ1_ASCIM|nr:EF-hand [Ascobolus immersus RN42]